MHQKALQKCQTIRQTGVIRKSGSVTFPTNPHLPYCLALLGCLPDSSKTRGGPEVTAWSHRTIYSTTNHTASVLSALMLGLHQNQLAQSSPWGEPFAA